MFIPEHEARPRRASRTMGSQLGNGESECRVCALWAINRYLLNVPLSTQHQAASGEFDK